MGPPKKRCWFTLRIFCSITTDCVHMYIAKLKFQGFGHCLKIKKLKSLMDLLLNESDMQVLEIE